MTMYRTSNFRTGKEPEPTSWGTIIARILGLLTVLGVVIVLGWFIFFRPGAYAIQTSDAQDYIWSIEYRTNSTASLWLRNADLASYCTADPALIAQLKTISANIRKHEIFVGFSYRSINVGDPEHTYIGAGDGCASEKGGVTIYKLTAIAEIPTLAKQ